MDKPWSTEKRAKLETFETCLRLLPKNRVKNKPALNSLIYLLGEVVAEFDVGTNVGGPVDNSFDGDYDYDDDDGKAEDDNYSPCRDPKSKITLFPLDNFNYPGNDPRQRPLELTKEVFQVWPINFFFYYVTHCLFSR